MHAALGLYSCLPFLLPHDTAVAAIQREKNLKHWPRRWKLDLIERDNPEWKIFAIASFEA
jgi:predicted GIY-YIG superfamily endonuclease